MKGSIRAGVGFLVAFGAVGGMDNCTDSELVFLVAIAAAGLALMYSGVRAMNR